MSTTRKLGLAAALLIASQLLSRFLGFIRDAVIAALFGATPSTDAFIAAFTIPDILNYVLAGGTLSITFIPIYARHLSAGDPREGDQARDASGDTRRSSRRGKARRNRAGRVEAGRNEAPALRRGGSEGRITRILTAGFRQRAP